MAFFQCGSVGAPLIIEELRFTRSRVKIPHLMVHDLEVLREREVGCLGNVFWRTEKDHVVTADIFPRQVTARFHTEVVSTRKEQTFQLKGALRLANRSVIKRWVNVA